MLCTRYDQNVQVHKNIYLNLASLIFRSLTGSAVMSLCVCVGSPPLCQKTNSSTWFFYFWEVGEAEGRKIWGTAGERRMCWCDPLLSCCSMTWISSPAVILSHEIQVSLIHLLSAQVRSLWWNRWAHSISGHKGTFLLKTAERSCLYMPEKTLNWITAKF